MLRRKRPSRPPDDDPDNLAIPAAAGRNPGWLRYRVTRGVIPLVDGCVRRQDVIALAEQVAVKEMQRAAKKAAKAASGSTTGPCPTCSRSAECQRRGLACEALERARQGLPWDKAPRRPSAWRFRQVHGLRLREDSDI